MSDALATSRHDAALIERLRAELEAQANLIRAQSEALLAQSKALAQERATFEHAARAARIGVWECNLADEALQWTDMVYELFEVPPGSALNRAEILKCYAEDSVAALHAMRSRAIEQRAGFNLDAEITTLQGRRRWIRITATVESRSGFPVRLFGMKQDITEEKIAFDRTRYLAEFDDMTGLANRSQFQSRVSDLDLQGALGALLLIDLDGFKQVNDSFGHAVGDECLREVASRLRTVCGSADLIARIGGDEFAVLLGAQFNFGAVAELAAEIVEAVRWPLEGGHSLGASVGIGRPDGCSPSELFVKADIALYAAKAAGRNTFRVFKPSMMTLQPHFGRRRSA